MRNLNEIKFSILELAPVRENKTIADALHHALELAQKLISDLKERIETDILAFWLPSFSIGIAEFDDGMKEKSELLNCADAAMYESKKNGGNTPVISKRKYR